MRLFSPGNWQDTSPVSVKIHTRETIVRLLAVTSSSVSDSEMTDCVDGAETLGGPDLVTGLAPGLRMEDMALAEKLDRTLLSNTG